jgi:hypothetical protein
MRGISDFRLIVTLFDATAGSKYVAIAQKFSQSRRCRYGVLLGDIGHRSEAFNITNSRYCPPGKKAQ